MNTDSSTLIGTDTFTGGEVRLRRGPVALAAQYGGFCILDEINMAKNDAVAVLHSALDYRGLIDVPVLKIEDDRLPSFAEKDHSKRKWINSELVIRLPFLP